MRKTHQCFCYLLKKLLCVKSFFTPWSASVSFLNNLPALSLPSLFLHPGFRRNEEMRAMEVLPILREKVAFLSGKIVFKLLTHTHRWPLSEGAIVHSGAHRISPSVLCLRLRPLHLTLDPTTHTFTDTHLFSQHRQELPLCIFDPRNETQTSFSCSADGEPLS